MTPPILAIRTLLVPAMRTVDSRTPFARREESLNFLA
jgi:hypothetical protein